MVADSRKAFHAVDGHLSYQLINTSYVVALLVSLASTYSYTNNAYCLALQLCKIVDMLTKLNPNKKFSIIYTILYMRTILAI